jgi:hypothetical protein
MISPFRRVVVLMLENHSFDHLLGWVPGIGTLDRTQSQSADARVMKWLLFLILTVVGCGSPNTACCTNSDCPSGKICCANQCAAPTSRGDCPSQLLEP